MNGIEFRLERSSMYVDLRTALIRGAEFRLEQAPLFVDLHEAPFASGLIAHGLFHPPQDVQNP